MVFVVIDSDGDQYSFDDIQKAIRFFNKKCKKDEQVSLMLLLNENFIRLKGNEL